MESGVALTATYQKIKDGIVSLRYQPGQKLSEARLAEELRVGRSPVRSALARLERDGWVRVLPQHGTFVRRLSARDVAAMTELRSLLEAHSAAVAATRLSREELVSLRDRFEALRRKGPAGHVDELDALDDLLHGTLLRSVDNPLITGILGNLRAQIRWVRKSNAVLPGRVEDSFLEMDRVLVALERRDPEAAAEAMRQHIENIASSFVSGASPHRTTSPSGPPSGASVSSRQAREDN